MENGKGDFFNMAVLGGGQGIQRCHPIRVVGPDLKVQFHNTTQFLVPNKRASDKLSNFSGDTLLFWRGLLPFLLPPGDWGWCFIISQGAFFFQSSDSKRGHECLFRLYPWDTLQGVFTRSWICTQ